MSAQDILSEQVRGALAEAEASAHRLHHSFIDTEHLVLGLMAVKDSVASHVLSDMGLDQSVVEDYIRRAYRDYPQADGGQPILYANGVERALYMAEEEASWLGHEIIGTEHVMLGLTRWQESGAAQMLRALGISPGRVRRRVRQVQHALNLEMGLAHAERMTRFSELAHRVLNGAIGEAARAGHATVGVEHLLVVLCSDQRNVAGRVLREMGIDRTAIANLVDQLAFPTSLTPIFELAVAEAARLGHHYIGTDHLLLGMTQDPAGVRVLRYLGTDAGAVQDRLREMLNH